MTVTVWQTAGPALVFEEVAADALLRLRRAVENPEIRTVRWLEDDVDFELLTAHIVRIEVRV